MLLLFQALGRDLFIGGDDPLGDLPELDGLVDVISLYLGGERRGEVLHLDLLEDACSFLLWLDSLTSQAEFQLQHGVLYLVLARRFMLKKACWRGCLPLEDQTEL